MTKIVIDGYTAYAADGINIPEGSYLCIRETPTHYELIREDTRRPAGLFKKPAIHYETPEDVEFIAEREQVHKSLEYESAPQVRQMLYERLGEIELILARRYIH